MLATQETTATSAIPSYFIYEVLNGRPLYYRGYKEVLENHLNPESIRGSSALQSILVSLIHSYIMLNRDKKKYIPVTNEAGVHLALTDNLSCDVAIFEKGTFAPHN
ncbi:hypothetical protein [Spirosoma aerolatum]|uniref:hypothetical protein n=1 Tax=Spirosoma aerolatum TaxID=1211326 RepID=UPI001FE38C7A|nr:hypothetical protein [Spirosoma aerolatum]